MCTYYLDLLIAICFPDLLMSNRQSLNTTGILTLVRQGLSF